MQNVTTDNRVRCHSQTLTWLIQLILVNPNKFASLTLTRFTRSRDLQTCSLRSRSHSLRSFELIFQNRVKVKLPTAWLRVQDSQNHCLGTNPMNQYQHLVLLTTYKMMICPSKWWKILMIQYIRHQHLNRLSMKQSILYMVGYSWHHYSVFLTHVHGMSGSYTRDHWVNLIIIK